ncbi:MAG: heavy metal translocating P-type ATPase [Methanothermobacter sp.]|nr:heavy metal translocating P-type ATPase [Methanothermobacter sp.]
MKVNIRIGGMSCAGCALRIEEALKQIDGVKEVNVNFATAKATIEYDPKKIGIKDIEQVIKENGYQVLNDKIQVKVGGMTCAMCAKTIESRLEQLEGIIDATVNLGAETAYIEYNKDLISIEDIKRVIEGLGYQFLGTKGELVDEKLSKDLKSKKKRIMVGLGVSIPLMLIMYLKITFPFMNYIMLLISILPFLYVSYPIFNAAIRSLQAKTLNMDVMYSMGIGVAFISSLLGTFNILSQNFIFYETALMLAAFLTLGRYLEAKAKGKTSEAIKKLLELQPETATLLKDDKEIEVPVETLKEDDILIVKTGDRIPADGIIIEGQAHIDESMVTGEPIPVFKDKGKDVVAGTINTDGIIKIRTTHTGEETFLAKIIRLVEEAQGSKPPLQRIADKAVSYFIPTVLIIAFTAFIFWYLKGMGLLFSLTAFISTLVVACPCALGLATPTAVTVGIGRGAELGILIKKGEILEVSEKITKVLFDKTGTLTEGKPYVTDIIPLKGDERDIIQLAASIEANSRHPIAKAIVSKAKNIPLIKVHELKSIPGKGLIGSANSQRILVGNISLFKDNKISIDNSDIISKLQEEGKTIVLVGRDQELLGVIAVSDKIKENSLKAINAIREMGLEAVMVTGDNPITAKTVAEKLGIDRVLSQVLPEDKVNIVSKMRENGTVAFVGDGINDAPALAAADVGIAIGSGTDVAIEAADIVLVKDDPVDVPAAVQLARKVVSRVKWNIFWAFAYNMILIPVAAGILYPAFKLTFRPEFAGLAMALSSVTVVSLSLLLRSYTPPVKKMDKNH